MFGCHVAAIAAAAALEASPQWVVLHQPTITGETGMQKGLQNSKCSGGGYSVPLWEPYTVAPLALELPILSVSTVHSLEVLSENLYLK